MSLIQLSATEGSEKISALFDITDEREKELNKELRIAMMNTLFKILKNKEFKPVSGMASLGVEMKRSQLLQPIFDVAKTNLELLFIATRSHSLCETMEHGIKLGVLAQVADFMCGKSDAESNAKLETTIKKAIEKIFED